MEKKCNLEALIIYEGDVLGVVICRRSFNVSIWWYWLHDGMIRRWYDHMVRWYDQQALKADNVTKIKGNKSSQLL